jgi:hypothetical protein
MPRTRIATYSLISAVLCGALACRNAPPPQAPAAPASLPPSAPAPLAHAAASVDALIDRFLAALATKDKAAIEQLRVSEAEYRDVILPGSVPPGQPPKIYPEPTSRYFWNLLNTKSQYSLNSVIAGAGGHTLLRKETRYQKGVQEYAWYRAYKHPELTLVDEQGQEIQLSTGSIAEVNGQYKFISFVLK